MRGTSHLLSGVAGGLAVAPVLGFNTLVSAAPMAVLVGGSAVLPDLDCPSAAASRAFGRVSGALSDGVSSLSGWIYQRTKGPRDEPWSGKHRHLSHTVAFALVAGGAVAGLCLLFPPLSVAVYAVLAILTGDRLGNRALYLAGAAAFPFMATVWSDPQLTSWQIGAAVTVGMVIHDLGDALTLSGCPLIAGLWPFEIAGETWFEVKLLGPLSFRTGGPVEHCLVYPLLVGATVMAAVPLAPNQIASMTPALPAHFAHVVLTGAQQLAHVAWLPALLTAAVLIAQRTVHHLKTHVFA